MYKFLYSILFIGSLTVSENSQAQHIVTNGKKNMASLSIQTSGDVEGTKTLYGEQISIGLSGLTKTDTLSVAGYWRTDNGVSYHVYFSIPVLFQTGVELEGGNGGFEASDHKTVAGFFKTELYKKYFDTTANGTDSKVHFILSEVKDLNSELQVSGKLQFNSAYDFNGDADEGKLSPGHFPPFDGTIRNTKKIVTHCTFTIYVPKKKPK